MITKANTTRLNQITHTYIDITNVQIDTLQGNRHRCGFRKKSIMTTEIPRFLSAQTIEHQRLNIVYKIVVAHIWNDIQQTNRPMLYSPPHTSVCTENMQVAQRAIWDRQPMWLSLWWQDGFKGKCGGCSQHLVANECVCLCVVLTHTLTHTQTNTNTLSISIINAVKSILMLQLIISCVYVCVSVVLECQVKGHSVFIKVH